MLKESVIDDLRALGQTRGRAVLNATTERLESNPLTTDKHLKTLRPNPVADRQPSLFGRYRVLFTVHAPQKIVTVVLVGEKRGNSLYVQGERFTAHESRSPK
jgi:hypothetical protein